MAFEALQLPDARLFNPNTMLLQQNQAAASNFLPQIQQNQAEAGSQTLADRSTLRGLAGLLAKGDPNALATAATLPDANGPLAVSTLGGLNTQQIGSGIALGQAWGGLPQGVSVPSAPWLGSPGMGGGAPANGAVAQPAVGPAGPPGLAGAESSNNPGAVNKQGYSGSLQFGTGRLADLGMYQPAQGENPNGNTWRGTITVPGFAPMTHAEFLQNPDAQRMAAEVHFQDIGTQIDNTPGSGAYDRNGLAAVAHLGGIQGMQQFVATGGGYNPHDANGTSLQNYYQRFSQGGVPALQQSFGHPDGPLPGNHPARGQQVAAAQPKTMSDASPATVPATPDAVQQLLAGYRAAGQPSAAPTPDAPAPSPDAPDPYSSYRTYPVVNGDVVASGQGETRVAASPEALANRNAPVPGQGMTAPQAVAQAQQELGARLNSMEPNAANALVQQRALEILQSQPGAAPTSAPAPPAQVASNGPVAMPQGAAQPMPPSAPPQTSAPAAVTPQMAPSQPAAAPAQAQPQATLTSGQPQVPPGFEIRRNNYNLPMMMPGMPGYAQAYNPQTGEMRPVPLVPPELSRDKIEMPDGSVMYPNKLGQFGVQGPPNSRDIQKADYSKEQELAGGLADAANNAQSDQIRLQHALTLASQIRSGANGGTRAQWANLAETYLPADLAKQFSTSLIGEGGAGAAQQFEKLMLQNSGSQERGVLGARGGYQAIRLFQQANPNLDLQAGSGNLPILNMQIIGRQADADYAQGALAHINQNADNFRNSAPNTTYEPVSKYDQQWLGQRNPQIYAAAMGAASGLPFQKWTELLKQKSGQPDPGDVQRVIGIVRRAKPNSTINWADGNPANVGSP